MIVPDFPLGVLLAGDPKAAGLSVRLFKNDLSDVGALDISQFQECDYPGYKAHCEDAWKDPVVANPGSVQRASESLDFRVTGAAPGQLAYGVFVTAVFGGTKYLLDAFRFEHPVPMQADDQNKCVRVVLNAFHLDDVAPA